jgi:hypothetical protein
MKPVSRPLPADKPDVGDIPGERDLLLTSLRVATTRSRLQSNIFDSIGVALRQKQIDCAAALAWLKEEGLLGHLSFRPAVTR